MNNNFTFIFPVLYSPNEPVNFLGFFTSWIRICICPYRSGSRRHFFMRIRIQNTAGEKSGTVHFNSVWNLSLFQCSEFKFKFLKRKNPLVIVNKFSSPVKIRICIWVLPGTEFLSSTLVFAEQTDSPRGRESFPGLQPGQHRQQTKEKCCSRYLPSYSWKFFWGGSS